MDAALVLREALALSVDDRADIAAQLLDSLGPTDDEQDGELWMAELERRARRALSGEDPGVDWATVRQRLTDEFTR